MCRFFLFVGGVQRQRRQQRLRFTELMVIPINNSNSKSNQIVTSDPFGVTGYGIVMITIIAKEVVIIISQPASHPASQPLASQPASHSASQPASHPTSRPASQPVSKPASHPASQPSSHPASQPASLRPPTQSYKTISFTACLHLKSHKH